MYGEIMALVSVFAFGLSYLFVNRAQADGETCDNGLLPTLIISTTALWIMSIIGFVTVPTAFRLSAGWQRPLLYFILAGISWNYLSRMALLASISKIGATRGLVVKSIAPMLTVALAVVLFKERLDIGDQVGFLLMLASIGLLVVEQKRMTHRSWFQSITTKGILLGIAAALFQSLGHLLRKVGADAISPLLGATIDMTAATLTYILYLAWTGRLRPHIDFYLRHTSRAILIASLCAAIGVATSFASIAAASISTVAMILGMQPVIMPILSSVFFPGFERFTWISYLATAFVSLGVLSIMMWR
ncbi:DMT family transporter [Alicyclobacillus ferrooxydans]|uniref:EamA domain-containing protein n=1 Tax=Alicyclobacillus ferrooxydans TaxID=471514 RepID=A0A0N8PNZ2_9BACL|nr:DMT family transporter [Alicyclobacillus ferrooxydans]KPV42877.1 hypothetical protein AN477_15185 [Alicyclobacillus ferrooxydans]